MDSVDDEESDDCPSSSGSVKLEIRSPSPRLFSDLVCAEDEVDSNSGLLVSSAELVIVWFVNWRFTCLG